MQIGPIATNRLGLGKVVQQFFNSTPLPQTKADPETPVKVVIRAAISSFKETRADDSNKAPFVVEIMAMLIKFGGYDPNAADSAGKTPLYYAVQCNQLALAHYLVNRCFVDITTRDHTGNTLLHIVRDKKMLRFLLDLPNVLKLSLRKSIQIEGNYQGDTPLHIWVSRNYLKHDKDIIEALLQVKGGGVNLANHDGNTLLHVAKGEMIAFLLKKGATIERNHAGRTPLHMAVKRNDLVGVKALVKALIEAKSDINSVDQKGNTPLHLAKGRTEEGKAIIKCLLDNGAEPARQMTNSVYQKPLGAFLKRNDIGAVCGYLSQHNPFLQQEPHLLNRPHSGSNLSKKSSLSILSKKGSTHFYNYDMCSYVEPTALRVIIETFTQLQSQQSAKMTVLQMTTTILDALIHQTAPDLNAVDAWGNTVLHFAVIHNQTDIVKYLLKCGVSTNVPNRYGDTVLHLSQGEVMTWILVRAVIEQQQKELLDKKEVVSLPLNNAGRSPLHSACSKGDVNKAGYLLGLLGKKYIYFDVKHLDNEGKTPLDLADLNLRLLNLHDDHHTNTKRHDYGVLINILELAIEGNYKKLTSMKGPLYAYFENTKKLDAIEYTTHPAGFFNKGKNAADSGIGDVSDSAAEDQRQLEALEKAGYDVIYKN